jgi:hypothetical protein
MKTITIDLYEYDELTPEAQEKAREWYSKDGIEYHWWNEAKSSLDTFLLEFGARVTNYDVGPYQPCYTHTNIHELEDLEHVEHDDDYMPTGYCFDCELWETYKDYSDKGESVADCIKKAVAVWENYVVDDMRSMYEGDNIAENIRINEYTFTSDGERMG